MENKKYVLVPGYIWTGNAYRYIDEKTLLDAFNVSKEECVVSIQGTNEHIQQLVNECDLTDLTPRGISWEAIKDQDLSETCQ